MADPGGGAGNAGPIGTAPGTGSSSNRSNSVPLSARFKAAIANLGETNGSAQISSRRNSIINGVNLAIATKNKIMGNATGIIHQLFFYSIFLSLFVAVTMSRTDETIPHAWKETLESRFAPLSRRLNGNGVLLSSFNEIRSQQALWKYLENTLASALAPDDDGSYGRSRLFGEIRAGQARSAFQDCKVPAEEQWLVETTTCFSSKLSKSSFGGAKGDLYKYEDDPQWTINRWIIGPDTQYGSGAYYTFLSQNLTQTMATFQDWKSNYFIDLHTRALFIDFTLYNPSLDLLSVVRLLFEMPIYGGVVPSSFFRICAVRFYDTSSDYLSAVLEGLFLVAFIKMVKTMVDEVRRTRWAYFKSTWNVIEFLNTFLFFLIVIITIVLRCCGAFLLHRIDTDPYINWQYYAYSSNQLRNLTAVNAVLTWVRILKYMRISSRMSMLERALTTARKELLAWLALFLAVYVSFVQAFYAGFHQLAEFKSISSTSMTLFHGSFGHLNFEEMQEHNPVIGPLMCIAYVCSMIFIIVNMLLVILEDAWTKTLEEIKDEQIDGLAAALSAVIHSARSSAKKQKKMLSRLVRKKMSIRGTTPSSSKHSLGSQYTTRMSYSDREQDDEFGFIPNVNKPEDEDEDEDSEEEMDDEEDEAQSESEVDDQLIQQMMTPRNYRRSI